MALPGVAIPYGGYWSSPFAKWQGPLGEQHALRLAAHTAGTVLAARSIPADAIDHGVLGTTVPQRGAFYGLPWLMGMIGAERVAGPTIAQACATGTRILASAADEIAAGRATCALAIAADRVSNGPHLLYPDPGAPGGAGTHEHWVLDNFERDPFAGCAMIDTAENVARRLGATREEQHEVVLVRAEQYARALADDRAFQRRYMPLPFAVPDRRCDGPAETLEGDVGIYPTSAEKLARLAPVRPGGTVTLGAQTHPADGNAGMIVTTPERARDLSARPEITIQPIAFGQAREERGFMPAAPIAAARQALERAGVGIDAIDAIKGHNPFAINDLAFARAFGIDWRRMNAFGSSLIYGHPQAPTALRGVIELIEELVDRGGGMGLFQGCAAGDSAMAVVLRVEDRRA
ncbi:thiolase family protein [Salinarimonas rosea]|uniref:thiolase family protein n=1 Tax=Salinarimonas rosea TaxID=552063 RepID=UPI00042439A5|nr:thiolase family protein [Salinarimonas rosea]